MAVDNNEVSNIKIRAKLLKGLANGQVEIKLIINHPMETGRKKDPSGQLIPAHFIQLVTVAINDKIIVEIQCGTGISKNPYFTFSAFGANVDDKVSVYWRDNHDEFGFQETNVIREA